MGAAGVGAATASTLGEIGAGALTGGAIGAVTNPNNPLKGAEFGALTGGVGTGVAPLVGSLGLGATATDAISGAVGGLAGSAATGRPLATGALEGGVAGGLTGAFGPSPSTALPSTAAPAAGATAGPAAGTSAVSTAAPAAVAGSGAAAAPLTPTPSGGASGAGASEGIGGFLKSNASWLVPVAGMAATAIKGQPSLPYGKQLAGEAANLQGQANKLESYYQTGTLPPGVQSGITSAAEAAKATIRSQYAAIGNSGSSAEAQDLAAVDQRMTAEGTTIALNLLKQGLSVEGMSSQLYQQLMGATIQQDNQLTQAFTNFAGSLVSPVTPATTTG